MSQISDIKNPWRELLLSAQAKFRDVIFHVETGTRSSGRRAVTHEYPKRDLPYAEDMGRHARRFSVGGYLIYRVRPAPGMEVYPIQRAKLINALEQDGPGKLVHPVFARGGIDVLCERYSVVETRERGGYTQFEMQFVEVGTAGNINVSVDVKSIVASQSAALTTAIVNSLGTTLRSTIFSP